MFFSFECPNIFSLLYFIFFFSVIGHYGREATRAGYARGRIAVADDETVDGFDAERVLVAKERLALIEQVLWRMPPPPPCRFRLFQTSPGCRANPLICSILLPGHRPA